MWDLAIITEWAEVTNDMTDPRTLQMRALILTLIFGALMPAEQERMRSDTALFKDELVQTQVQTKTSGGETVKTIGGPAPLAEKGDKSEKDSDRKNTRNEKTIPGIKEYTGESLQDGGEVEVSKRKRSKRRGPIRERRSQLENDITQPPKGDETSPIIPRSIMELTEGRQTASQKKFETDRKKRVERSIGQIARSAQVSKT
ncbi:uncharacterized protein MONOS_12725 [Monocercomonoides exilis]|uniref:uncharacterized protein n=1 Tax=Monocercomonoides exilis TaxID=2049356 RepID=UPI00355A760A|nr:hypothetical protein MONOS_12725 [Monocercomonoides exilis]|eukprot:MONOS_12725.1-p1 / transcript=MONOS_12725.1 / gene=MONOS_12725 / organism=Monocercomonoides_exilis_PA203 / gene_product=unspecified product / transcript_product=unspecified product / location=Mono_scaffold00725:4165-5124(+) / protein_length=201 / sequence_SO=supercontig / SO=protein_coding / is_pseudo=false